MGQAITGVFQAASDLLPVRVGLAKPARPGGLPRSIRLWEGEILSSILIGELLPSERGEFPPCSGGNLLYKLL